MIRLPKGNHGNSIIMFNFGREIGTLYVIVSTLYMGGEEDFNYFK